MIKIKWKDIITSEVAISEDFFKKEIIICTYIVCNKLELRKSFAWKWPGRNKGYYKQLHSILYQIRSECLRCVIAHACFSLSTCLYENKQAVDNIPHETHKLVWLSVKFNLIKKLAAKLS